MKKVMIIALIFLILIPAVSAEVVYDENLVSYEDTSWSGLGEFQGSIQRQYVPGYIVFEDITHYQNLYYIVIDLDGHFEPKLPTGRTEFSYTFNGESRPGVVYKSLNTNLIGEVTSTQLTIFLNNWDIGTLSGRQCISLPFITSKVWDNLNRFYGPTRPPLYLSYLIGTEPESAITAHYTVSSSIHWKNRLLVENTTAPDGYEVMLFRTVDGNPYTSTINISQTDVVLYTNSAHGTEYNNWFPIGNIDSISVISPYNNTYHYAIDELREPDTDYNTVTVYIRNSQTGAAIANSRIVIDALVDGDYYPVVNRTEPSGIFSVTLQATGGGMPNPDGYRLIATADGYNNPMPEINFTVDEYITSMYCYLDPIAGGPLDENKTFIDFFVRDLSAKPISGASVNFGGYTLITNSAGYTIFEVEKNNTYSWTVSKSGYGSLNGNAVIGSNARHTINSVIAPAVTPTTTTPIPTSTHISPTPTMTAPTGEPVSNLLEWFAAHFGMVLGGGVEIGKIFMWLCFTVPVGVYVGKEAKAGAAGFMAGAGIVTLFFVLIGWVPIWLVVLLALIIGLFYAKVFNPSDNGGGR